MPTDWTKAPDWDALRLGGVDVPGIARVNFGAGSGLDIQKPKGGKKAKIRDDGTPAAKLTIEIELLPSQLAAFESTIAVLRPRAIGAARQPLTIVHPTAALWGVGVVKIGEIEQPHPKSGGSLLVRITAYEWVDHPVAVKKAKDKPEGDGWDGVDGLIHDLAPSKSGAAEKNFSSADEIPWSQDEPLMSVDAGR